MPTKVTVWNENRHEQQDEQAREVYPDGIHTAIAEALDSKDYDVRTATLDEPEHGLSEEVLDDTDVLIWWSHIANDEVKDEVVDRVISRIHNGMGFIPLHSARGSKVFKRLMGTSTRIKWRHDDRERLWVVDPSHPIADGIEEYVEIPEEEMYGEPQNIPKPDEIVFIGWFAGGEVLRSGCCYKRGKGRIFYFQPGHEEYPIYYQDEIRRIITNATEWATPLEGVTATYGNTKALE
ncbi:ThuA domain-containing protein [Haladaptatus pallidirubidus]|uniref:Trehalose utilization protein ThuA n=1 Tax=Haladaptatus pallidirubidus TaxID=1008152 RepID=A0AAV3UPA2_9EURY|nr:ThuA domain-containing protein [Haladaptatus pallidirubidus]